MFIEDLSRRIFAKHAWKGPRFILHKIWSLSDGLGPDQNKHVGEQITLETGASHVNCIIQQSYLLV